MSQSLFVSLDGPKGTGKTTLLEAITKVLRADNRKVIRLCERNNDPFRRETMALVNQLARNPDRDLEWEICQRLADSRAWISRNVLPEQPAGSIILIDRWYPSDAAFRRLVPFSEILRLNLERGVRVPDLHVGVVTSPEVSWARAAGRSRGLGSTVIHRFEEHVACTEAFERAVEGNGWVLCRNDGAVDTAVAQVVSRVYGVLGGAG